MSESERQDRALAELLRWGLKADTLSAEANRGASELEDRLHKSRRAVIRAIALVNASRTPLDPCQDHTLRIEELARASAESATRADLLALNFQVEAARLDDDRGLDGVAHEIRSLADRGTRGASEIDELAAAVRHSVDRSRDSYEGGHGALERAAEEIERALRAAQVMGRSLAGARSAMAQFSAGAQGAQGGPGGEAELESASRLAAAAQVRGETIERLTRAIGGGLRGTSEALEREASRAEHTADLVETFQDRLTQLVALIQAADEIARRAKQLAINADLAATRSDDPAFGLFAEDARRLSEQSEETSTSTQRHLRESTHSQIAAARACRELATSIREMGADLTELLARFDEGAPSEGEAGEPPGAGRLGEVFRVDRAAAQELAQARAGWRQLRGEEPADSGPP